MEKDKLERKNPIYLRYHKSGLWFYNHLKHNLVKFLSNLALDKLQEITTE